MNIRLIGQRVAVKRDESEEVTAGGIIKPDMAREEMNQGLVMAIGGGERLRNGNVAPMSVRPGDRVIFGKYGGADIEVDGERIAIVMESEIFCVIEDDEKNGE